MRSGSWTFILQFDNLSRTRRIIEHAFNSDAAEIRGSLEQFTKSVAAGDVFRGAVNAASMSAG